jgi:hypothetical protein
VRGQLHRVLENCRLVVDAKRRLQARTPRIIWGFHLFAHNVDDVDAARSAADDIGVYADGSIAPCRGSFYPQDDVGHVAADDRSGAATFREAWTGEGLQTARRLFRERTTTPQTRESVCLDCPALLDWHRFVRHVAERGRPLDWMPAFDSNQRYNYFWSRATHRRGAAGSPTRPSNGP